MDRRRGVRKVGMTELRRKWFELVGRAERGERIGITKRGKLVAVLGRGESVWNSMNWLRA